MTVAANDEDVVVVVFTALLARNNPVSIEKVVIVLAAEVAFLLKELLDLLA
jgi:hypothetical protein